MGWVFGRPAGSKGIRAGPVIHATSEGKQREVARVVETRRASSCQCSHHGREDTTGEGVRCSSSGGDSGPSCVSAREHRCAAEPELDCSNRGQFHQGARGWRVGHPNSTRTVEPRSLHKRRLCERGRCCTALLEMQQLSLQYELIGNQSEGSMLRPLPFCSDRLEESGKSEQQIEPTVPHFFRFREYRCERLGRLLPPWLHHHWGGEVRD
jgi:hypothetical protein